MTVAARCRVMSVRRRSAPPCCNVARRERFRRFEIAQGEPSGPDPDWPAPSGRCTGRRGWVFNAALLDLKPGMMPCDAHNIECWQRTA